jgi:hypothetical protein
MLPEMSGELVLTKYLIAVYSYSWRVTIPHAVENLSAGMGGL